MRSAANWLTLGTPLGLLIARITGCQRRRGPRGLHLAIGYRPAFPKAAAFTVGNVVMVRRERFLDRPGRLEHEERHATQWAVCLGVIGFPLLYGLACLWSLLVTGDHFSRNVFEHQAGLLAGGYEQRRPRNPFRA